MLFNGSSNQQVIVAGENFKGSTPYQLDEPKGIFVDSIFNLYVADYGNNRIQYFQAGQINGKTIAGNRTSNNITLNKPTYVILDADGSLYVTDNQNHRIIRSVNDTYQCIVGCKSKQGSTNEHLIKPYSLHFNSYGNLFVADGYNSRIQKFTLVGNNCVATAQLQQTSTLTTVKGEIESTTISTTIDTSNITISFNQTDLIVTSTSSFNFVLLFISVVMYSLDEPISSYFVPKPCLNTTNIDVNSNISNTLCDIFKPCQNNGICTNIQANIPSYFCSCQLGFSGIHCEFDYRPCKQNTCLYHDICNEDWQGINCESMINFCNNIICWNNGVCRPLSLNYTCECLGDSYSSRLCEITSLRIKIYKIVSKSFSYVAIIAMSCVVMFVIIVDILKYCFGIDPTREDLERYRREKRTKQRKPVIQQDTYVNTSSYE
ncbi:unnamed protein product [Rotaria sp. Silwood2]|nr:unnamed protein product [Rotaria sp. Silwood2]